MEGKLDIYTRKKGKSFPFLEIHTTLVASFTFLCTGLLRSYTSPAVVSMKAGDVEIPLYNTSFLHDTHVTSMIASAPPFASFIGTLLAGPLLQFIGRQKTIVFLTLPYILGWLCIGMARNLALVVLGRALTGLAAGFATAAAQLYVSECVRAPVRGKLGFLTSMMLALGVLLGFLVSTINVDWQTLAFMMMGFPIFLLALAFTIPESPYWLLMKGCPSAAWGNLRKLRGAMPLEEVQAEFDEIEAFHELNIRAKENRAKNQTSLLTMLSKRSVWYPALISGGLMTLQQMCGANAFIFYCSLVIQQASPSHEDATKSANQGSTVVGIVQLLAFFISLPLVDRFGRKFLLILSALLMTIMQVILGTYFYFLDAEQSGKGQLDIATRFGPWLPLTVICSFIAAYSIGFGPVPFIIMGEIFPSEARSYLCSMASFVNHFILFLVILMFPSVMESMSPAGTFYIFATFSFIAVPFVIFVVKETRGKTLTEIEIMFNKDEFGDSGNFEEAVQLKM